MKAETQKGRKIDGKVRVAYLIVICHCCQRCVTHTHTTHTHTPHTHTHTTHTTFTHTPHTPHTHTPHTHTTYTHTAFVCLMEKTLKRHETKSYMRQMLFDPNEAFHVKSDER